VLTCFALLLAPGAGDAEQRKRVAPFVLNFQASLGVQLNVAWPLSHGSSTRKLMFILRFLGQIVAANNDAADQLMVRDASAIPSPRALPCGRFESPAQFLRCAFLFFVLSRREHPDY
jgi:hypothetical protein